MTNNGIEIKNVGLSYSSFSLKDVSLSVPRGTVMGFIGRNGAGKSTLINCMAGCRSYTGKITVNGIDIDSDRVKYFSDLSIVFDEMPYNNQFKIKKMLKSLKLIYPTFDEEFFLKYLEHFGIDRVKTIEKLSFGMKKKLQLIIALATKPQTLVLDEPTAGIDPADRMEILDMLQDFMLDENHTLMLSTHITSDLDKIADYITLIDDGKIVFSKSKDSLQEQYRVIRADRNALTSAEMSEIIGLKENHFGIEGVTDNKKIWSKQGVTEAVPTVEEIMLAFVGREEK